MNNITVQPPTSAKIPTGPSVGTVLDEIRRSQGLTPLSSTELASLPPWTEEEADAFERAIFEASECVEGIVRLP